MSSFRSAAFDPVSGTVREAYWIDDHFGKHRYGVRFDDGGPVYDPKDVELRAAGAEITRLRSLTAELVEALELILPLAKGYNAYQGTGCPESNRRYVQHAEAALSRSRARAKEDT